MLYYVFYTHDIVCDILINTEIFFRKSSSGFSIYNNYYYYKIRVKDKMVLLVVYVLL